MSDDDRIRRVRNTTQTIGVAVSAALLRLVVDRGVVSDDTVNLLVASLGPEVWLGVQIVVGAVVYRGLVWAARWVAPEWGAWLEGPGPRPNYPKE